MEVDSAYSLVKHAIDNDCAASGYLIVGDIRGNAMELARKILRALFQGAAAQIDNRTHPDVIYLEGEGKARNIKVESMRDKLVAPMAQTSFSGGWKVGVIVGADRMRAEAANAFLKTLEEPTPKTMYLLLTDAPENLLPTIVSRTQRIDLESDGALLERETEEEIAAALAARDIYGLVAIFSSLKEDAPPEDLPRVRKAFFLAIMQSVRQKMIDGSQELYKAFRNVEAVETAFRQSELAIADEAVISQLVDRLA